MPENVNSQAIPEERDALDDKWWDDLVDKVIGELSEGEISARRLRDALIVRLLEQSVEYHSLVVTSDNDGSGGMSRRKARGRFYYRTGTGADGWFYRCFLIT